MDFATPINKDDLRDNCTLTLSIECSFCGATNEFWDSMGEDLDALENGMAEDLDTQGWGEVTSGQYQAVGFACSACIKEEKDWREENGK